MYKDRGIIKWAPFDALVGFKELINKMHYNRNKKPKPILSSDQLENMDYLLQEALIKKLELVFDYYEDGYIKTVYGKIKKVDQINQLIILNNNLKLTVNSITNIIKL